MKIREKLNSKVLKNIGWLLGGQLARKVISAVLTFLIARYLGPSNYGIISYISSYTAFFASLCDLGINGIIVKEYVQEPTEQGKNIFTALVLKLTSSTIACLFFVIFMFVSHPNEPEYYIIAALLSLSSIFNAFDVISYWYQSKLQSKKEAIVSIIAYLLVAVYKIVILKMGLGVEWFAFANSLDYIAVAILLVVFYFKDGGQKWEFSFKTAKNLLRQSYHLILSGVLVAIFAQIDKIMIGNMMSNTDVGYYSTAVTLAGVISFLPTAVINSVRPVIMEKKKVDEKNYVKKVKQLFSAIIWMSILYSLFMTIFARPAVSILYGEEFIGSVGALRVIVWYCAFSYLGGAKNVWLVAEGKQKYEKWFTLIGAILNILLNSILIPCCGIVGAAIASLVTQAITNFVAPLMFKETRACGKYMIEAFVLKGIINKELADNFKK